MELCMKETTGLKLKLKPEVEVDYSVAKVGKKINAHINQCNSVIDCFERFDWAKQNIEIKMYSKICKSLLYIFSMGTKLCSRLVEQWVATIFPTKDYKLRYVNIKFNKVSAHPTFSSTDAGKENVYCAGVAG